MARPKNDGRGRIGGRAKGTKNKPQPALLDWADAFIKSHRAQFEKDFDSLNPQERAAALSGMITAVIGAKGESAADPR